MKATVPGWWGACLEKSGQKPPALFLDYDGTLVPIAPTPERAVLDASTRRLVRTLARHVPVTIISGRGVRDLRSLVRLDGVVYAGNHGFEIGGKGVRYRFEQAVQWRRVLRRIIRRLEEELGTIPGILLEDKGLTLSVHYRLVRGASRRHATRRFFIGMTPFSETGLAVVRAGKAVWEVRPPIKWNKGYAVRWILRQPPFRKHWPLYIGDDDTDQDAFRMIRRTGLGISVGPPETKGDAHHVLGDPNEVRQFLNWLLSRYIQRRRSAFLV